MASNLPTRSARETGKTRAARNKEVRRKALREQLAAQGHVQHVAEIAAKIMDLSEPLDPLEVSRLKAAAELKIKLIGKYLPDIRQVEMEANLSVAQEDAIEELG